jgi:hypothetical protein
MKIRIVMNDTQRRLLCALLVIIALCFYVWILHLILWTPPGLTEAEQRWIEERMAYHGAKEAVVNGTGCWFERDGRKVKL